VEREILTAFDLNWANGTGFWLVLNAQAQRARSIIFFGWFAVTRAGIVYLNFLGMPRIIHFGVYTQQRKEAVPTLGMCSN
jgi:hypothetical protein